MVKLLIIMLLAFRFMWKCEAPIIDKSPYAFTSGLMCIKQGCRFSNRDDPGPQNYFRRSLLMFGLEN